MSENFTTNEILDVRTVQKIRGHYDAMIKTPDEIKDLLAEIHQEAKTFSEKLNAIEKIVAIEIKQKFIYEQVKMFDAVIEKQKELQEEFVLPDPIPGEEIEKC